MRTKAILFATLLVIAAAAPMLTASAQGGAETYAIRNARIVTVTGPVIENGTIVISDGKITAVGKNLSAPAGAKVIDATGLSVYPGMIDSGTTLGLV